MSDERLHFVIPMKAESTANKREHWAAKAKRTKRQRDAARLKCPPWSRPFLVIHMVRVGPRTLDDDNLRSSLKAFRDGIAARLRVDDASPLVRFTYSQQKGKEPAVVVTIEPFQNSNTSTGVSNAATYEDEHHEDDDSEDRNDSQDERWCD